MMRQQVSGLMGRTGGRRVQQQGEVQMFKVQCRDADGGS
jgi:hypothetical protein